jgi:hypothetical protein
MDYLVDTGEVEVPHELGLLPQPKHLSCGQGVQDLRNLAPDNAESVPIMNTGKKNN